MPTGYTAEIYEGKNPSPRDFILRCVRGMGAFVTLRDDPLDKEVPQRIEASEYEAKALARARERMAELVNMTPATLTENAEQAYLAEVVRYDEARAKNDRLRTDYLAMLRQVDRWTPPTDEHKGLYNFMVEQLQESIKFDCVDFDDPNCYYKVPARKTAEEWHRAALAEAARSLDFATKHYEEEVERTASRNAWIAALFESLPAQTASVSA